MNTKQETFVVLGNGIAGLSAAASIRERKSCARVVLVGEENALPYSRPMLTKTPLRGSAIIGAPLRSAEWYTDNNIELLTGRKAVSLDIHAKTVTLDDNAVLHYDKCVYALGARCFVPPVSGADKQGVVTIRNHSDINNIRRILLETDKAVVIGGGVIGVEIAWELKKSGVNVTVIEYAPYLMERVLDETTARTLENALKQAGIEVVTGASVNAICGNERVESVALTDGSSYAAGLVVLSTGIRPNTELAEKAGLSVDRSVTVNARMQTSDANVYACGDCAGFNGANAGIWAQSETQGKIAGANAAGEQLEYQAVPYPVFINVAGLSLFCIGDMGKNPNASYQEETVVADPDSGDLLINRRQTADTAYEKYYYIDGRMAGAALVGDLTKLGQVKKQVTEGAEK